MGETNKDFGHPLLPRWRLSPDIIYLNHGGFGAGASAVVDAAEAWRRRIDANPTEFFEQHLTTGLRQAASVLGGYFNARGEDIVFVDNATSGLNAVLRSLVFMPGDEVVATNHMHRSSRRTLDFVCERAGARLVMADMPFPVRSQGEIIAAVLGALSPRTRLVMLEHVTPYTALHIPLQDIATRCNERGVPVLVYGAHSSGNAPIDLEAFGAAGVGWYAGSCEKWIGAPSGSGFLWVHPDRQALIRPVAISNRFGEGFTPAFDWPGLKDFSAWLSVPDALAFRRSFKEERIIDYTHGLARDAAALLADRWGALPGAPPDMFTAMANVEVPTDMPATTDNALSLRRALRDDHRIEASITPFNGRLWVRLSAFLYNELSDYERLADAVLAITGGAPLAANA
ncbi:MAG: aminotransferase class V-fold PLP-dependent enzyme [Alphaproteobacteria bacterium]|nr:aminotransferase class V-fold PLP-dependent enzyme [Alphaproteobacteria bacterium]